ncbi:SEP-domain-containing protein [Mycena amicta]|nr:SEP-domain-containing protein [Mycena amicta]
MRCSCMRLIGRAFRSLALAYAFHIADDLRHKTMSGHFSANNDDDDREDEGETWFAGGERSGISVQNPNSGAGRGGNLVRDLLKKAEQEGAARGGAGGQQGPSSFGGAGHTLGGQYIAGPDEGSDGPVVIRRLTFWREGFTVDNEDGPGEGEYRRYDDPANAGILRAIDAGEAPLSILNVLPNQPVDVQVQRRTEEDYVPPPPKPFSGTGNRLGAATAPTTSASTSASASSSSADAAPAGRSAASINTRFEVDQTRPMTSVQIRLADGTRIVCRMNLTHTVGDLRNFINASRPENLARAYTIGTTFPNRVLQDDTQTVEAAGVGGAVVVQRWV